MNIRTLTKKDTLHIINLGSMVIAWGVTCSYFESFVPNAAIYAMERLLLAPVVIIEKFFMPITSLQIMGNPGLMFIFLWTVYFVTAYRLSSFLVVKSYDEQELRSWYESRKSFRI